MEACIFCNSPLDGSDEHIIPQSVNGRLHSKDIICHDCNSNFFGKYIDPVIKNLMNPIIGILGWENASSMQFENIEGEKYVGKPSDIRPIRPVKVVKPFNGGTYLSVTGDPKNALKMFQKEAKKLNDQGKASTNYKLRMLENSDPYVSAKWGLTISTELILLMNKIALEFYAFNKQDYSVIEQLCLRVRAFDKSINNAFFCNTKNEVRDFATGEISHLIIIQNEPELDILYVYIEIFNIVCCMVILSDKYQGPNISFQYHQDALTGERFTDPVKLKMGANEIVTYEFDLDKFGYLFNSFFSQLQSRGFMQVFNEHISEILADLKEDEKNGKVESEKLEEIYIERTAQVFAHLSVFHYPYIVEDRLDEEDDDYNYIHSNFRKEVVDEFCNEYRHLLGKQVIIDDELLTIKEFYKNPIIVKKDKELVQLYFILVDNIHGDKRYIKVKKMIDMLIEAIDQQNSDSE